MTTATELRVGIARHAVAKAPGRLVCVGVGSCVVITIYDAAERIGALAHVLLPDESAGSSPGHPARFATTAVPLLIHALKARGANGPYVAKIAGGAGLFADVLTTQGRVGERNVNAARQALATAGVPLAGEDVGGGSGRSIVFDVDTGKLAVRSPKGDMNVL
jgi:chemotaxis protein CheD